jgi:HK97 family phage major capsid protein
MTELAETIEQIAGGLDRFKRSQSESAQELRQRLESLETRLSRPGVLAGSSPQIDSKAGGLQFDNAPTAQERKAFSTFLRTGDRQAALEAKAAISAGTTGQGLEAVSTWFDNVVRGLARDRTPILKLVTTQKVGNFPARHVVTARGVGFGWIDEQSTRGDTDAYGPKAVDVAAGEWYALPTITEWALHDLCFDVESWLRRELAMSYADALQSALISGNGTNKPTGFLSGPTPVTAADSTRAWGTLQYIPSGVAATLPTTTSGVIDLLLDVSQKLNWTHRQNATWVMSSATMCTLRKFKDADGRPILLDSMISGQPTTLMGYPVAECEAMPPIGANAFPIAFGNFEAGYVLDVDDVGVRITRDEITKPGFVKFYARQRVGGKILDSEAIKLVKVAAS